MKNLFELVRKILGNSHDGAKKDPAPAPRKNIEALHKDKIGKISDKWASFLPYYDALFAPLRDAPIAILEIGVQNGGSLETWSAYFRNAVHIIGCDIDERCALLRYDDPRIQVIVGDVNEPPAYQAITAAAAELDIVIDDGSHYTQDIIQSFVRYFPLLNPGGIYVVEDAHALYWFDWKAGIIDPLGGYNFFKRLIDLPNYEFWQDQNSISSYMADFFPADPIPQFMLDGWIDSIEFRNSLIVVKKALGAGHGKLGNRATSGSEALVEPLPWHVAPASSGTGAP